MPRFETRYVDPVELYNRHGNNPPSFAKLQTMHRRLNNSSKPSVMRVVADISLDLVCSDAEGQEGWLSSADETLDCIIQQTQALKDMGYQASARRNLGYVAQAYMKKAELNHWAKASTSEPLSGNYPEILDACAGVLPLIYEDNQRVGPIAREFVPILLGARMRSINTSLGWFGRLALSREDYRSTNMASTKTNWDTAIIFGNSPGKLLNPDIKLQVKTSAPETKEAKAYERGGSVVISSAECEFDDAKSIIYSCLRENNLAPGAKSKRTHFLSSDRLDEITWKIMGGIAKPWLEPSAAVD